MLHEFQFRYTVWKNLYIAFGGLCLSYFFSSLPLPFLAILVALVSGLQFFRSETCRVHYLSFSTLHHATTDFCPQEKNETWKNHHVSIPSSKFGLSSKVLHLFFLLLFLHQLFLLRRYIVSFCIFQFLFIFWKVALLGVYFMILQTKIWE